MRTTKIAPTATKGQPLTDVARRAELRALAELAAELDSQLPGGRLRAARRGGTWVNAAQQAGPLARTLTQIRGRRGTLWLIRRLIEELSATDRR